MKYVALLNAGLIGMAFPMRPGLTGLISGQSLFQTLDEMAIQMTYFIQDR